MPTWAGSASFGYEGLPGQDTIIFFGRLGRKQVSSQQYVELFRHFRGRTVELGTSRTAPPPGSVGAWLKEHVTRTAIASYLGPILVEAGWASRTDVPSEIRFAERVTACCCGGTFCGVQDRSGAHPGCTGVGCGSHAGGAGVRL
jgi:hypothetical protein